jgi:hypothetical protein
VLIDKKVWLVTGTGRGMAVDIAEALADSMTGLARLLQVDTGTRINTEESASLNGRASSLHDRGHGERARRLGGAVVKVRYWASRTRTVIRTRTRSRNWTGWGRRSGGPISTGRSRSPSWIRGRS